MSVPMPYKFGFKNHIWFTIFIISFSFFSYVMLYLRLNAFLFFTRTDLVIRVTIWDITKRDLKYRAKLKLREKMVLVIL